MKRRNKRSGNHDDPKTSGAPPLPESVPTKMLSTVRVVYGTLGIALIYFCNILLQLPSDNAAGQSEVAVEALNNHHGLPPWKWNSLVLYPDKFERSKHIKLNLQLNQDSLAACSRACVLERSGINGCVAFTYCLFSNTCTLYFKKTSTSSDLHGPDAFRAPMCHSVSDTVIVDDGVWWPGTTWWAEYSLPKQKFKFQVVSQNIEQNKGEPKEARKDYSGIVSETLAQYGTVISTIENDRDIHLYWGLQWTVFDSFQNSNLKSWQQINMLPGMAREILGDKDALHEATQRAFKLFKPEALNFILPSFKLPDEKDDFIAYSEHYQNTAKSEVTKKTNSVIWIMKQLRSWSGQGVTVSTPKQVVEKLSLLTQNEVFIAQQYVDNPLTLRRHKFDLRWWALITSINPLRVRVIPDAYPKVAATKAYDMRNLSDSCIHVTNSKIQSKCKKQLGKRKNRSRDHPTSILDPKFLRWLGDSKGVPISNKSFSLEALILKTNKLIVKSILVVLDWIREKLQTSNLKARPFQFLAYDIIYDDVHFDPFLEEVNTNGYLGSGFIKVQQGKENLHSMFKCIGIGGYSRYSYEPRLMKLIERFCEKHSGSCSHQNFYNIVQEFEDEVHHCGNWKLAFPTQSQDSQYEDILNNIAQTNDDRVQYEWLMFREK